jgi:hypothetical protein
MRWGLIKAGFSRVIPHGEWLTESRVLKRERGIRQRRYWEHLIRDERYYDRYEYALLTMGKSRWQIFAWPVLTPPLLSATM